MYVGELRVALQTMHSTDYTARTHKLEDFRGNVRQRTMSERHWREYVMCVCECTARRLR